MEKNTATTESIFKYIRNWDRSKLLIFVAGSFLHLIAGMLQFNNLDWLIEYHSALDITIGIPFYEQQSREIGGQIIWKSNHFPTFFYALALVLSISPTQVAGRIFLWIYSLMLSLLFLDRLELDTGKSRLCFIVIYYVNPITLAVIYNGLFDLFLLVYLLAGIYLVREDRELLGGLFLGLAILVKYVGIIPLLYFGVKYLFRRDLVAFVRLNIIPIPGVTLFIYSFWQSYQEVFVYRIIGFHLSRQHPSLAIWYYLDDIAATELFTIYALAGLIVGGFVISYLGITRDIDDYLTISSLFVLFIMASKTFYNHYGIWFMVLMVPALLPMRERNSHSYADRFTIYTYGAVLLLYTTGLVLCAIGCYSDPTVSLQFAMLQAVLHLVANLLVLSIFSYHLITGQRVEHMT